MFSDELRPGASTDNGRLQGEPRRIGEFMPAILARYGIEPSEAESDSPTIVFVPTIVDFAIGVPLASER
jgi:hypothetical protein